MDYPLSTADAEGELPKPATPQENPKKRAPAVALCGWRLTLCYGFRARVARPAASCMELAPIGERPSEHLYAHARASRPDHASLPGAAPETLLREEPEAMAGRPCGACRARGRAIPLGPMVAIAGFSHRGGAGGRQDGASNGKQRRIRCEMATFNGGHKKHSRKILSLVSALLVAFLASGCDSNLSEEHFINRASDEIAAGQLRAAVIDLKNALQKNPKSARARLMLGKVYVEVGDGASAEKELIRARDLGADKDDVLVPLGKAYLLRGKFDDVLSQITVPAGAAEEKKALVAEVETLRGFAQLGLSRAEDAAAAFRSAIEADPDSASGYVGLARLAQAQRNLKEAQANLAKAEERAPKDWDVLMLKGDLAFLGGDFATSEAAFAELVKMRRDSVVAHIGHARADIGLKKLDRAAAELDTALKVAPNQPSANYFRALAAFQNKDYKAAQNYIDKVLNVAPDEPTAILLGGAAAFGAKAYEQAAKYLAQFVSDYPDHAPARRLLAAAQVRLGQNEEAIKTLKPLLQEQPKDADLLAMVGTAALRSGNLKSARDYYARAVELKPENARLRAQLGATKMALGETEEGASDIAKAVELDPSLAPAEVGVVLARMRAGEFDRALEAAKALQTKMPNHPAPFTLAGLADIGLDKEAAARTEFAKALETHPGDPDASANLSALEVRKGDLESARKYLEASLEKNPGHLRILLRLAEVEQRSGHPEKAGVYLEDAVKSNPDSALARVQLGRFLISRREPLKAVTVAQEGLQKSKNDVGLLEVLATAQIAARQKSDAVGTARLLTQLRPQSAGAHYLLATAYEASGDYRSMKASLDEAVKLDPANVPAKIALARYYLSQNNREEVKKLIAELKQWNGDNPDVAGVEGLLALAEDRPKDAVPLFEKALDGRQVGEYALRLAAAKWESRDQEGAIATLRDWTQKVPDDAIALWQLGGYYLATGKLDDARKALSSAVEKAPNNWGAQNDLAWAMLKLGDASGARPHAEKAYDLSSKNPLAADTLGMVLLKSGDNARAVRLLQDAADGAPSRPEISFHLAKARAETGDADGARQILRALLTKDHSFPERDEASSLLKQLGG
jgi:putative PEP-CTERM system TPR-repeat lipoprotein